MSASNQKDDDCRYMAMAIDLARRGLGTTSPNPSVGAVLVQGRGTEAGIVGRGWTQPGGRPHAEVEALARAGERARGACAYVTLEPCSHHGKTPPCADALIDAGVARVVVAIGDPDARVAGRGCTRLREAGIEVVTGVLAEEARWLTAGHILRVNAGRPFVQLKLAVSKDGKIAAGTGKPVWVTGALARQRGHLLRAEADAILVGRATVEADDPDLTCRLPGLAGRSPIRVVLDTTLKTDMGARLIETANTTPVIIFCAVGQGVSDKADDLRGKGVLVLEAARGAQGLDPQTVLEQLAGRGVTRLMLEGGPGVARSFFDAGLVDEAVIFRGSRLLGEDGLAPMRGLGLETFADDASWRLLYRRNLNGDQMSIYQNRNSLTMLQS